MQYICYNCNIYIAQEEGKIINRVKIARMEKNMSQEYLANVVGVTRQTIGLIESGNYNPSLKLCISIAKALGKTLNDLFWMED